MRLRRDSGSASVEAVALVFPILVLILILLIFCFRLVMAQLTISSATAAAARAASLARTPQAASVAARAAAAADLADHADSCSALQVDLDESRFRRGGEAVVTLSCRIDVSGLTGLALPGNLQRQATSRSPIDTFRALAAPILAGVQS